MTMLGAQLALLAGAFAAGTAAVGWWAVPLIAVIWGIVARHQAGAALMAGLAAMIAWAALLGVAAAHGRQDVLTGLLELIFRVKPVGLYGLAIAFPGLIAVTGSLLARSVARR